MFLFRLTTETLIALLYRGEWPSGLGHYNENRKVPGSNLTRRSAWLKDQTHYEAPADFRIETAGNAVITIELVRMFP